MVTRVFRQVFSNQPLLIILVVIFQILLLIPCIAYPHQEKLYDDLFSVVFTNEKDGWACGRCGTILHTADGGKTWARQNSGTQFTLSSISFVDPQNGWTVGDEGTILHTADGGKTWDKQKSPISYYLMKVYFATLLKGWIVTERTTVLFTDDGGKTWIKQFSGEDYILKAISFCDALNGWAVGEYGYIYHTSNGGVTWEKQAGMFRISRETGEIVGGTFLFDVVAVNPKTAWAVGIDGYVTKTLDGGRTWKPVVTGGPKTQFYCVASDRAERILIGGNGTFLSSADGGKTWRNPEFKPAITYGWIYGVTRRGNSGFVLVGGNGVIYLNNEKGPFASWNLARY
jgi:hypothetical protein